MIRFQMKTLFILTVLFTVGINASFAQVRNKTTRTNTTKQNNTKKKTNQTTQSAYSAYGQQNAKDTTTPGQQQSAYGANAGKTAIDTSLPIKVIQSSGGGLLDTTTR